MVDLAEDGRRVIDPLEVTVWEVHGIRGFDEHGRVIGGCCRGDRLQHVYDMIIAAADVDICREGSSCEDIQGHTVWFTGELQEVVEGRDRLGTLPRSATGTWLQERQAMSMPMPTPRAAKDRIPSRPAT